MAEMSAESDFMFLKYLYFHHFRLNFPWFSPLQTIGSELHLKGFGEESQGQNYDVYNINEVTIETQIYIYFFITE